MRRAQTIPVRVSKVEKARIEENAEARGLTVSEFLRQCGCGELGDLRPPARPRRRAVGELDAFEDRVRELARTMPRSNARRQASRELERAAAAEKARAARAVVG